MGPGARLLRHTHLDARMHNGVGAQNHVVVQGKGNLVTRGRRQCISTGNVGEWQDSRHAHGTVLGDDKRDTQEQFLGSVVCDGHAFSRYKGTGMVIRIHVIRHSENGYSMISHILYTVTFDCYTCRVWWLHNSYKRRGL